MAVPNAHLEARIRFVSTDIFSVLSVSDSIEALLGFCPADLLDGKVSLKNRIHPDDQDIADEIFSSIGDPLSGAFNIRLRQSNGRIRCIKGQYTKSLDARGHSLILELLLQDAKSLSQRPGNPPMMDNLRAMMENTDDYIYFKDRNHVFTGASQTLVAITSPAEHWTDLLGQTDYDVFPEEYADIYYQLEKQVFAGISVAHEVQEIQTKDGKKGWVDNRKYPIRNDAGEITGLFGIARDITEQKRIENALAESEQRFRSIFEQVPMISVQGYDRNHQVIFWNQASEALYGFTREQALGRHLEDLIIPEPMQEGVARQISAWVDGGPAIPAAELTLQNADGHPVEVFSSHVMLWNKNGEPEMYCIDIDISERKRMAAQLQQEQLFSKSVLDNLPGIFYIYTYPENRLAFWNKQHETLLGYQAGEMAGRHITDWHLPEAREAVLRAVEEVMSAGHSSVEAPLLAKDGHLVYFALTGVRFEAHGRFYLMGIGTDITERKKMEEQVRQLAFHDPLTNLPNRRLLHDRLGQAMVTSKRSGRYGALIFLDLDNFKSLNDTLGHEVGDLLLIEATCRLKSCVREVDTVARFGGDEFVVMISELDISKAESSAQAVLIAEKIRSALSNPYFLTIKHEGIEDTIIEHRCTASIGLTLFRGHDVSQDDILKQSDRAMYQAKDAGRNVVQCAPDMPRQAGDVEGVTASFLHLAWHSGYECGNSLIDAQHRSLFDGANKILAAILAGRHRVDVDVLIDALMCEVAQHFNDEEAIFSAAGFPDVTEHAAQHRQLVDRAVALVESFHAGTLTIGELLQFLAHDMVARHMLGADREFFPYLENRC